MRVLTEALLRDGLGILDEVELVDLLPHEVDPRRVDATSWNLLLQTRENVVPLVPDLTGRWLGVSAESIAAINAANPFKIDSVRVGETTLLSFRQGLAAWDSTEDSVVLSLLQSLPQPQLDWPSLSEDLLHPGALQFFKGRASSA